MADTNTSNKVLAAASAVVVAIVAGGIIYYMDSRENAGDAPVATAAAIGDAPVTASAEAAPAEATEADVEAAAEEKPAILPTFDLLRVAPDGRTTVAGRFPGQVEMDILVGDEPVLRVTTEPSGDFYAEFTLDPSDQPRIVTLLADPEGQAIRSEQTMVVDPFGIEEAVVAEAEEAVEVVAEETAPVETAATEAEPAAEPTEVPATEEVAEATIDTPDTVELAEVTPVEGQEPSHSPQIMMIDGDGAKIVQPSGDTPPEVMANVAVDTITYDASGEVEIAGRAPAQGSVRIYLDNAPLADAAVAPDGAWQSDLTGVETGVYTLRVDQVDAEGKVISRVETPFKREERDTVAAAMAEDTSVPGFSVAVRTVQPGNTLWAIAQDRYGEGVMYVKVFEANKDAIRNPDLIYPGQVFVLPE